MSAYKDKKTGKWFVFFYYRDWQGNNKGKTKRGFQTKREALEWERKFKQRQETNLDMSFKSFVEIYSKDMKARLKLNTWLTKENIIQTKLIPTFGSKKINEIRPADVIAWQNKMLAYKDEKGNSYSETYLKTVHNQLSAIFNHAVRYYELKSNPAAKAGNMGKAQTKEIEFWTKEEYLKFSEAVMDKPLSFYAFEMLYWCGIRLGELLALTPADFDFEKGVVTINKSYQRIQGEDVVMKSTGEQFRSWCYVVDCVSGLLHVLLKGENGEVYNIADEDSNITIRQLAELIAGLVGRKVIMKCPDDFEKKGYNMVSKSVFSTKKLEALGWNVEGCMRDKMLKTITKVNL